MLGRGLNYSVFVIFPKKYIPVIAIIPNTRYLTDFCDFSDSLLIMKIRYMKESRCREGLS